jgi:hypothetical protein
MKRLFVVAVVLLVCIAALGFYRGWFDFSTNSTDQKPSATITVDKDKFHADEEKVQGKMHDLGQNVKERTGNGTEKVK